ncbi:hypothetical protein HOLleu_23237 [Holothuria leucospilota]|uniref:Uncharacterized protein n=1 Tax=Holothuria leucospilota TaxID=206669 RepID=A0A9Q1BUK1_HOLLE|nr:hypothetical protein HOLleu_23237 [Holothuria leucospilota]
MSSWWEDLPCPFHPTWELDDISERDVRQLKQNLDADDDNGMVVETAVYRAFLEFPRKRVFYNQPIDDPIQARKHLISAKELVKEKFEGNSDAEIGYGIVINTFQMYIEKDASTESILRDLILKKDGYPRHQCYVNVVRAYILSRLGPRRYGCALSLFDSALKESPENCDWLLGKALLIGREAREIGYILGWSDRHVLDLLHEQKVVLEGILKLEPDYHLARALYGQVLMNLGEGGAKAEISRSLLNDPPRHSVGMVAARF